MKTITSFFRKGKEVAEETTQTATVEDAIGRATGEIPGADVEGVRPDGSPGLDPFKVEGEPSGEDAIALVQIVSTGSLVAYSKFKRIELTPEIMKMAELTSSDKEQLRPYAPSAAKFIQKFAQHSDLIMALFFLGIAVSGINTRLKTLAELQAIEPATVESEVEKAAWTANSATSL